MGEKGLFWFLVGLLILSVIMGVISLMKAYAPGHAQRLFYHYPALKIIYEIYGISLVIFFVSIGAMWQGWIHPVLYDYFWFTLFVLFMAIALHIVANLTSYLPQTEIVIPAPKVELAFSNISQFVYLALREDGVYKVGMSTDPNYRMRKLAKDYDANFAPIAIWQVGNMRQDERLALELTKPYHHTEGRRKELRAMTTRQAYRFIADFTGQLRGAYEPQ